MIEFIGPLNYWLSVGVIVLQIATAYLLIEHFLLKRAYAAAFIRRFGIEIVFLVSVVSSVLTLIYSEMLGIVPCGLCWLQRIFLYPLPVLFGVALVKGSRASRTDLADYGIALSAFGGIIALYHHYIQMGGSALSACPTAGEGVDCARRIIFEFGYITFPLMAFSVFAFIIATLLMYRRSTVV